MSKINNLGKDFYKIVYKISTIFTLVFGFISLFFAIAPKTITRSNLNKSSSSNFLFIQEAYADIPAGGSCGTIGGSDGGCAADASGCASGCAGACADGSAGACSCGDGGGCGTSDATA